MSGNSRGLGARLKNVFLGNYREHKEHPARNLKPGEQGRPLTTRLRNLFSGYRGRNNSRQASTGNATRNNRSGNNATRRRNSNNSNNSSNNNSNNNNNSISSRNKAIIERVKTALKNNETIELSQYEYDVIKYYRTGLENQFTEKTTHNGPQQYGRRTTTWVHESE